MVSFFEELEVFVDSYLSHSLGLLVCCLIFSMVSERKIYKSKGTSLSLKEIDRMDRHIYVALGVLLVLTGFGGVVFSDSEWNVGITSAAVVAEVAEVADVNQFNGATEDYEAYNAWFAQSTQTCRSTRSQSFLILSNVPFLDESEYNPQRVGCCPNINDCSTRGQCYTFGKVHAGDSSLICGGSGDWDECMSTGSHKEKSGGSEYNIENEVSDDGSQRCMGAEWVNREDNQNGNPLGGGINVNLPDAGNGLLDAVEGMCSEGDTSILDDQLNEDKTKLCRDGEIISCSQEGNVQGRYVCSDEMWVVCGRENVGSLSADNNALCTVNNNVYRWQSCNERSPTLQNGVAAFCARDRWFVCNRETAGSIYGNDEAQCAIIALNVPLWSTQFIVSEASKLYELSFVKNVPAKQTTIAATNFGSVSLCDEGTAQVSTHATLCYNNNQRISVPSMAVLANGQLRPTALAGNNAIPYYSEGSPKKVSIVLLKSWNQNNQNAFDVDLDAFAQNLLQGRRLAFIIDQEYYVVSHPQGELLNPAQIEVVHLPTMQRFTLRHVGSNWYQAEVLGGKFVALRINEQNRKVQFQKGNQGEQLQAYPVPYNLAEQFEVAFRADAPIVLSGHVISVCAQDNSNDPQIMQVCSDNQPRFTLQRDVMYGDVEEVLLFQRVEQAGVEGQPTVVKQGYVFTVQLPGRDERSAEELDYNTFITALTNGKRVAIGFSGQVYLLEHAGQEFSLSNLKLVKYAAEGKTEIPAAGNELKVSFRTAEGEIYLRRQIGNNAPPPFQLWAKTNDQLGQADMDAQLFTSFNSLAHVAVAVPQFGNVQKDASDIARNRDLFKISIPGLPANSRLQSLAFEVPKSIQDKVVFYYDGATRNGQDYVKSVTMYRYYDVTGRGSFRTYDDAFLDVFTNGNDLSLKFDDSFYLLGYRGEEGGFFSVEDLSLTSLDGETEFEGEADVAEQSKTFVVGEGRIIVRISDEEGRVYFNSQTGAELVRQDAGELVQEGIEALQLRADNSILINGITYTICDTPSVEAQQTNVLLCKSDAPDQKQLFARGRVETEYVQGYLVLYKGRNEEDAKVVTFQKVQELGFNVALEPREFAQFGARVGEGQAGAYVWSGKYFELTAADPAQLATYALRTIPEGQLFPIGNVQTSEQELSSGTIIWDEKVVNVTQEFDNDYNVQLRVRGMPYMLLPAIGVNVTMGEDQANQQFRTRGGTVPFKLQMSRAAQSPLLTFIVTSNDGRLSYFIGRLPNETRQDILLPDDQIIRVTVINSTFGVVHAR